MGRFTGYWWSPDAKSIAYEEADAEGVEVWQVADPIHPDQPAQPFFYPRPGKANVKVPPGNCLRRSPDYGQLIATGRRPDAVGRMGR